MTWKAKFSRFVARWITRTQVTPEGYSLAELKEARARLIAEVARLKKQKKRSSHRMVALEIITKAVLRAERASKQECA